MSTIRKLFAVSTVAAAAALTACGGGDSIAPTANDVPAIAVSPTNVAAAKAAAAGLIAAPAVTLPALTSNDTIPVSIPAGTTLKFTAPPTTGTTANTLSGFTLTSGAQTATGIVEVGSCKFTVITGDLFPPTTVLTFDPCSIDFNTAGLPTNGTTTNITASVKLGGTTVPVPNVPVSVTVVNGVAQIISGGTTIATGTVSTGATN